MSPLYNPHIRRSLLLCLLVSLLMVGKLSVVVARADSPLGEAKGEHVVLIGGTFAERLQYFGYFESLLTKHESKRDLIVRNMGWAGDEVALMPRSYNFVISAETGEPDDEDRGFNFSFDGDADHETLSAHLTAQKAGSIFLCFGTNEAFKGKAGLNKFAGDYQRLLDHLAAKKFNGKTAARLIVVSPIAQENLGAPYSDPKKRNLDLKMYMGKIAMIAKKNNLLFIDLFTPTLAQMGQSKGKPLTIDGSQLNPRGQKFVAEVLATGLGMTDPWSEQLEPLRELIVEKNKQFFYRWRPINAEYVYGRRRTPFGVISYPPEMAELDKIITGLEKKIHLEAKNN